MSTVIRELRGAKGLTQMQLAKRAKVTQGYISQVETGTIQDIGAKVAVRLAKALGVPVTRLLE